MIKKNLLIILFTILLAAAGADACPMCKDSTGFSDKTRQAYNFITIVMLTIPVSIGLGIIYFVRKKKD